jgi:hypothetical protein
MSVEFDSTSHDEQPEEQLPAPASHRRRWIVAACTGAAIVMLGGGAVALAQTSASASATGYATHGAGGYGGRGEGGGPGGPGGTGGTSGTDTPIARTPHLSGAVKSVSGTKILITDPDGFTRTIITSAKTTYKDSLTASPAVGTKIEAEGTVDADGTSLDAATIQAPRGPGGGMGPGHGGPDGGPRPTGAPTGTRPTGKPSSGSTATTPAPTPSATTTS